VLSGAAPVDIGLHNRRLWSAQRLAADLGLKSRAEAAATLARRHHQCPAESEKDDGTHPQQHPAIARINLRERKPLERFSHPAAIPTDSSELVNATWTVKFD
jgi:hypothetical protein